LHDECDARAMIDITIKKIREKLDSGDKFRDLVDARFDKIID